MAVDYREVLKDLKAEESRLSAELEIVKGMIPGAELMASRMAPAALVFQSPTLAPPVFADNATHFSYVGLGTKNAILKLLGTNRRPMMPSDITKMLLEGGIQSRSSDFAGMVGSTLTQMKGDLLLDRVEDGWIITEKGIAFASGS